MPQSAEPPPLIDAPPPVGQRRATLAPKTRALYAADWARWQRFCSETGQRALPAEPAAVAAFLQAPGPGRGLRTRRLAALDLRHRQLGLPAPGDDPGVRAALRRARKALPRRTRPERPDPAELRRLAAHCGRTLRDQRDRALLLLLAAGLRRTALVRVQAEHVSFQEAAARLQVDGCVVEVARAARHDLCPVRALEQWLQSAGIGWGPVFRGVDRGERLSLQALGADAIRLILRRRRGAHPPAHDDPAL